jgi:hypothetical protein
MTQAYTSGRAQTQTSPNTERVAEGAERTAEGAYAPVSIAAVLCAFLLVALYSFGVYSYQTVTEGLTVDIGTADIALYLLAAIILSVLFNEAFSFIDRKSVGTVDPTPHSKGAASSAHDRSTSVRNASARGAAAGTTATARYDTTSDAGTGRNAANAASHAPQHARHADADQFRLTPCRETWRIVGIILAVWAVYLLLRFPGNVDPDTLWEILQTYGYDALSDHHPFFDNLVFGAFWHLGDVMGSHAWSVFLFAVLQSLATALVMATCVRMVRRHTTGPWPARLTCLFFACYPIVPAFAQTMCKDSLNGWLFLLFMLQYLVVLQTRGRALSRGPFLAGFILTGILTMLTKKTGVWIIVLVLVFALPYLRRGRVRTVGALAAMLIAYLVVWPALVLNPLNVESGESSEMMSVPSQQVAYLIQTHGDELTDDDWEVLQGVFDNPDQLDDVYVPYRADATKGLWDNDATTQEKVAFARWYLGEWVEHPGTFSRAWAANISSMLFVDTQSLGNESLLYYRDNLPTDTDAANTEALESDLVSFSNGGATPEEVHDLVASAYRSSWASTLSGAANTVYLAVANLLAPLFSKVLFCTWLVLFTVFYGFHRGRRLGDWFVVFGMAPTFVISLTLAAGPVVLPRYMVLSVYLAPLTVALPWLAPSAWRRPARTSAEHPASARPDATLRHAAPRDAAHPVAEHPAS